MKVGVLEVLLVKAHGLKHCHSIGSSGLYAFVQCGTETYKGKIATGKKKRVWWNEKFVFNYASMEWQSLTQLTVRIMKKDKFREDTFVGETKYTQRPPDTDYPVHLGGVVEEGSRSGCIHVKPTPFNVVLSDGTYQGQVKIGLKFTHNVEVQPETEDMTGQGGTITQVRRPAFYTAVLTDLWRVPWAKLLFFRSWSCSGSKEAKIKSQ